MREEKLSEWYVIGSLEQACKMVLADLETGAIDQDWCKRLDIGSLKFALEKVRLLDEQQRAERTANDLG